MGSLVFRIAGSGGSDGVTAADDLAHWWKMTDGTTTAADFGVDSDGTSELTHHNTPTVVTGPTALGSPDALSFDGLTEYTETLSKNTTADGSGLTAVGTTLDLPQFTICFWMRDRNTGGTVSGYNAYQTFWAHASTGNWSDGLLCFWRNSTHGLVFATDGSPLNSTGHLQSDWADNSWHFWMFEVDESGASFSQYFDNGTPIVRSGAFNAGLTDTSPAAGVSLSFACEDILRGTPERFTKSDLSDIRIYKRLLTTAEKAAIYAGDW
jgi:hypothetical protein